MRTIHIKVALFLISFFISAGVSHAHGPDPHSGVMLLKMAAASDAIFLGRVVNVQYRVSEKTESSPNGIPHTFVTYQIQKQIRGRIDRQLVLRFAGGTDGRGSFMLQNNIPAIRKGDTDVLFVSGGKLDDCPLVDCVDGRFRVIRNRIYNSWGIPVLGVDKKGRMTIGGEPRFDPVIFEAPRPKFEDLIQRPELRESLEKMTKVYSIEVLKKIYDARAPKVVRITLGKSSQENQSGADSGNAQGESEETIVRANKQKAMVIGKFLSIVSRMALRAPKPKNKVVSVDPNAPFMPFEWRIAGLRVEQQDSVGAISDVEREESESMLEGLDRALSTSSSASRVSTPSVSTTDVSLPTSGQTKGEVKQ